MMNRAHFLSWLDTYHNHHDICGYSARYVREEVNFYLNELGGMAGVW